MAARPTPSEAKAAAPDRRAGETPRLYLITPAVADAAAFAPKLAAALSAADVAAVLLRLQPGAERDLVKRVKTLAEVAQRADTALLVEGDATLAVRGGADGAHLSGIDPFMAAAGSLKPARIAGCGGLASRHDAMRAGEEGADYAMFGEPDADGGRPAFAAVRERIEWWAALFEIPCVGYAADLDEAAELARAGADFVALGDVWDEPGARVAAAAARLRTAKRPDAQAAADKAPA